MSLNENSGQVHVAPFGHVYLAPMSTALPTNVTTAMATVAPAYVELGYLDENGVTLTPSVSTTDLKAWQSLLPIKSLITAVGLTAKIALMQTTQEATQEYFWGGQWINSAGEGKLVFSSNPDLQERVLVVEFTDDDGFIYRFVYPHVLVTDRDALQIQRTQELLYGMTFEVLDLNGSIGYALTNNPDLIPAS